jgi:hypothetical protein
MLLTYNICIYAHTHAHTFTHAKREREREREEELKVMEMKVGGTCMLFGLVEVCHHLCLNANFVFVSPLISHSKSE